MAIQQVTYQDVARKEDLVDVVTNVSPKKTPLLSGLQEGPMAMQTLHQYLTATYSSSADNAKSEGAAFSASATTTPARATNITQIFKQEFEISGTEAKVGGTNDPVRYQINKNLVEHAKDLELAFMAGSTASGASGTARRLTGVINALTTGASTVNSGSSLGETIFNNLLEAIYSSTDDVATEVYCGGTLKRDISGFTANQTRNVSADDKRLVNAVDVYESDFGIVKSFLHRDVPNGANAKMVVMINPAYHAISYLTGRRTMMEQLPKAGDSERYHIITEATLEHRGEATGSATGGFTG